MRVLHSVLRTPGDAEQFNSLLTEALREREIPYVELREPDRQRRVEIIRGLVRAAEEEL